MKAVKAWAHICIEDGKIATEVHYGRIMATIFPDEHDARQQAHWAIRVAEVEIRELPRKAKVRK